MSSLRGSCAILTGASRGIGPLIARAPAVFVGGEGIRSVISAGMEFGGR